MISNRKELTIQKLANILTPYPLGFALFHIPNKHADDSSEADE